MLSPEAIRAIQAVKDSVERPHWQLCEWLSRLSPNQSKRLRTDRYVDGATSIMDILGGRASTEDVDEFDRRYDCFDRIPLSWVDERLQCANELWQFALDAESWASQWRPTPVHNRGHEERYYCPRSPTLRRRVSFAKTPEYIPRTPMPQHSSTYNSPSRMQPQAPNGSSAAAAMSCWWWPTALPTWYVPSMVPNASDSGWCTMWYPVTADDDNDFRNSV
ncbi:hypothetical protein C8Q74DRAFT_1367452 [Fomes fomentarius]|nr:hypothetical protein C8Q74DRAFT_1367452 [Fomes fomentarius]